MSNDREKALREALMEIERRAFADYESLAARVGSVLLNTTPPVERAAPAPEPLPTMAMVEAGLAVWVAQDEGEETPDLHVIYRAMRALEPGRAALTSNPVPHPAMYPLVRAASLMSFKDFADHRDEIITKLEEAIAALTSNEGG
jgi:hypothetical protein